jgi:hypothetical protein
MENSVTIDLTSGTASVNVPTFDQAFLGEDYSDAKGRGRARRKKRKLERVTNRQEVKQARRGGRQEARLSRRAKRKQMRQEMRSNQAEARQERRDMRSQRKQGRENYETEQEIYRDGLAPEESYEAPETQDYGSEDASYDDQGYSREETGTADQPELALEEGYTDEEYPEFEPEEADYSTEDEMMGDESSNFISEATGGKKPVVPANVQEICMKIEWNNEFIDRLKKKRDILSREGQSTDKPNQIIKERMDRIQELEGKLDSFAGADGKFDPRKMKAVQIAKARARKLRMKLHGGELAKQITIQPKRKMSNLEGEDGITVNYVDSLPEEDPLYMASPITDDVDVATSETKMNFSGSGNNSGMLKSVLIGAVVGFTAIYVIRKYKLFK